MWGVGYRSSIVADLIEKMAAFESSQEHSRNVDCKASVMHLGSILQMIHSSSVITHPTTRVVSVQLIQNDKEEMFKECSELQPQAQSSCSNKHIPYRIPCSERIMWFSFPVHPRRASRQLIKSSSMILETRNSKEGSAIVQRRK